MSDRFIGDDKRVVKNSEVEEMLWEMVEVLDRIIEKKGEL